MFSGTQNGLERIKYFPIVFKNASERVINTCREFWSFMGTTECVVCTNFAACRKIENQE